VRNQEGSTVSDKSQQQSDPSKDGKTTSGVEKRKAEQASRLSDALRGNLRRRKAQSKSRVDSDLGSKGPGLLAAIKSDVKKKSDR
jgi:hypothetical protein